MPAPSRAGGAWCVDSCTQVRPVWSHNQVVFCSRPPLAPPKRTTPCRLGSKAAEASYNRGGWTGGDCRVHVVPLYVHVLSGLTSARPPNITTSPVTVFVATAAAARANGTVGGNNSAQSEPLHCHMVS